MLRDKASIRAGAAWVDGWALMATFQSDTSLFVISRDRIRAHIIGSQCATVGWTSTG